MNGFKRIVLAVLLGIAFTSHSTRAAAQDLVGEYRAFISQNDVHNSSGIRLTKPWEILRQDRANFHRFGIRDPADQFDGFFANEANRAIAETLLSRGTIDPFTASRIVAGNVFVRVQIYGRYGVGEFLRVFLEEPPSAAPQSSPSVQSQGPYHFVDGTRPPDDWLSLRTAPGPAGVQVAKLYNGTRLQVLFQQPDNWWRVRAVDMGLEGWVLTSSGSRVWVYCCR